MGSTLMVPAMIVDELRVGLRSILGQAASDISTVIGEGCMFHPQRVEYPLRRMDRARALLELIGWTQTRKPGTVLVDLDAHRWALMSGLERALLVGCENTEAADNAHKGSHRRIDEQKRDRDVVRLLVLRQYLGNVEIQSAALDIAAGYQS